MKRTIPGSMRRKRKALLGAVASAALMISVSATGVAAAASQETAAPVAQAVTGSIDEVSLPSGAEVFVYVPHGIELDRWTAPVLLVMDDEPFTAERAKSVAESTGLAENAKGDNAVISFVNPVGDTWGAADLTAFDQIVNRLYIERPNPASWSNGRADGASNGRTADYPRIYAGYSHRISIIADGGAADFVSANLIDDALTLPMSPPPASWLPASVLLFNTSAVPQAEYREWPAVVVNGTPEVEAKYASLNPDTDKFSAETSPVTDGFDAEIIAERYDELTSVRRQQYLVGPASNGPATNETNSVLLDIADFEALGVAPEQVDLTLSGDRQAMYLAYVPETIDRNQIGTVPLVLAFHGSGERAEWLAMHTEWPALAAEEGFIVVAVDDHIGQRTPGSLTTDQVVEVMDDVFARYPSVDRTRVYGTGFSMGSVRTINTGTQRPDLFAAIVPMHVTTAPTDTRDDLILPTMYMAGERDPFPSVLPSRTSAVYTGTPNSADRVISHLYKVNGVRTGSYAFDTNAGNPYWGIDFDDVETIAASKGRSVYTVNSLRSADGMVYTKLVNTSFLNHNNTLDQAPIAWEFMKQFSRNEDGSISIEPSFEVVRAYVDQAERSGVLTGAALSEVRKHVDLAERLSAGTGASRAIDAQLDNAARKSGLPADSDVGRAIEALTAAN
jgi:poly(3-hydroxybutyrate) depolymerase